MLKLRNLKVVITAGGIGTRLLPFSKEIPKEMVPILMKNSSDTVQVEPIIHAIFEQLYSAGIRDFFIVVGRGKRAIQEHFTPDAGFIDFLRKRGRRSNGMLRFYRMLRLSNLVFVNQPEPLGFGDAVLRAKPYMESEFLVHAGDTLIVSNGNGYLERLCASHLKYHAEATILLQDVEDAREFGVVSGREVEKGVLQLTEAIEKPEKPKTKTAIMPVYLFNRSVFLHLSRLTAGKDGEIQLTDALQSMIRAGKMVLGVRMTPDELRLDIGSPQTLLEALMLSSRHLKR